MKNVYFIGIGGIGMSALARYFAFKGYNVSGYDKTPSELTAELIKEGIGVHYEDDITAIPKDVEETLVVYTPAIPEDLGELVYVNTHGYRVIKRSRTYRPDLLALTSCSGNLIRNNYLIRILCMF